MDTVYSISEGKIKTSKSIPLPSIVKSMANSNYSQETGAWCLVFYFTRVT